MKCPECGESAEESIQSCIYCGAAVSDVEDAERRAIEFALFEEFQESGGFKCEQCDKRFVSPEAREFHVERIHE